VREYAALREKLIALSAMPAEKARALLLDTTTPALVLHQAALAFYGPTVASYEPDTLWTMLDVPEINRDKLQAALTLQVSPSFYWDIRVFGATCCAFNDQPVHTELTAELMPEHLAYGIIEAQLLFQLDTDTEPEFDDEVAAYVAACLAHAGLVYTPPLFRFAKEHLERLLSPDGRKLGVEMKKIAGEEHPEVDKGSALGVQLARYEQIIAYIDTRRRAMAEVVRQLT
jgi:hypothetical protein